MIVGITYILKTNELPIIHQHTSTQEHITLNVIEPKPITIEEEICISCKRVWVIIESDFTEILSVKVVVFSRE